jgi:hypothetical protein
MTTATDSEIDQQLERIERKLAGLRSVMELLVALRVQEAGHAKTLREAVAIARDPERALALFPEDDGDDG